MGPAARRRSASGALRNVLPPALAPFTDMLQIALPFAGLLGLSAALPQPLVALGLGAAPDMRLANCTRTGFDIRDPEQVMECLHGAQEAIYCDRRPFTEESYPGAHGLQPACHNQTFNYKMIAPLHDVHLYVDGGTKATVAVGAFGDGKKTPHPMVADHYITTILLISTDPGVGPGHRVLAMKQFDPAKDKEPEATFTHLPHTRVRALAHCNLHGAWATEKPSVIPGGGR